MKRNNIASSLMSFVTSQFRFVPKINLKKLVIALGLVFILITIVTPTNSFAYTLSNKTLGVWFYADSVSADYYLIDYDVYGGSTLWTGIFSLYYGGTKYASSASDEAWSSGVVGMELINSSAASLSSALKAGDFMIYREGQFNRYEDLYGEYTHAFDIDYYIVNKSNNAISGARFFEKADFELPCVYNCPGPGSNGDDLAEYDWFRGAVWTREVNDKEFGYFGFKGDRMPDNYSVGLWYKAIYEEDNDGSLNRAGGYNGETGVALQYNLPTMQPGQGWELTITYFLGEPAGCKDRDGDGFAGKGILFCQNGPDCVDTDKNIYPGAPEICDGEVNSCENREKGLREDNLIDLFQAFEINDVMFTPNAGISSYLNIDAKYADNDLSWSVSMPNGDIVDGEGPIGRDITWDGTKDGDYVLEHGKSYTLYASATCKAEGARGETVQSASAPFHILFQEAWPCYGLESFNGYIPSPWPDNYCYDKDDDGYYPDPENKFVPKISGRKYGDCNDDDKKIYPGAREKCDDGKNSNCDPAGFENEGCPEKCEDEIDNNDNGLINEDCCDGTNKKAGDPVGVVMGNFYYNEVDLSYLAPSQITVQRNYNAVIPEVGPFGAGTNFNYDVTLVDGIGDELIYKSSNGKVYNLTNQGDGSYAYMDGAPTKAYRNPSGYQYGYRELRTEGGGSSIFDTSGNLVEQIDGDYTLTMSYDAFGNITSVSDTYGRSLSFEEGSMVINGSSYSLINSITDDLYNKVEYSYESTGLLNAVTWSDNTSADPRTIYYSYNANGLLNSITDPTGTKSLLNIYDENGRVVEQSHEDGQTLSFIYNSSSTQMINPYPNIKTVYDFDEYGYQETITDSDPNNATGFDTSYTRDSDGRVLSTTNPLGEVTNYTYTTDGLRNSVIDPSGNQTIYFYEDTNNPSLPTKVRDTQGNDTVMVYDTEGNITSILTPGYSNAVTMTYTSTGLLNSTTDQLGVSTTYSYDSSGMMNTVTHEQKGVITTNTYDAGGRLLTTTDASDNTTSYSYSDLGRSVTTTDPMGGQTTMAYDDNGNLASVTDPRGNTVSFNYTNRDMIMSLFDQHVLNEEYTYTDPSGNVYTDRPYTMTDRLGQTTTYTYGNVDRYSRVDYNSDNEYEEFVLDGAKRMTRATSSVTGDITYTYTKPTDPVTGLVNSTTSPQGTVAYTYDTLGRRASMSASGLSASYTYNTKGLLNSITFTNPVSSVQNTIGFTYDTAGRRTGITYPNSASASYIYNSTSGELDNIKHIYNSFAFEDIKYTYDTVGFVNSIDRAGINPILPGFMNSSFDSANRHWQSEGISTPIYDANGNMIKLGNMVLDWDQKNRLVGILNAPNASGAVSYTYDAIGHRASKVVNSVTTEYLYDGINLIAQMDSSGNVLSWYVYSLNVDEPLAMITNSGDVRYYHADILGSVVALTNSSGTATTQYNYSPFGMTQVIGEDIDQPFRFTGREWDNETGMYYYRARYYSPTLARFITEDPIRFASGDVNWYRYVGNNPINNNDPMGLDSRTIRNNINKGPNVNTKCSGGLGDLLNQLNAYFSFKQSINMMNMIEDAAYAAGENIEYGRTNNMYAYVGTNPSRFLGLSHSPNDWTREDVLVISTPVEGRKGAPQMCLIGCK